MGAYIGCFGLPGIALFIVFLLARRRKMDDGMQKFYTENSLYKTEIENSPLNVRANLGESDNLYFCPANLPLPSGRNVEFGWWEWYLKSTAMVNNAPSTSFNHHLAVSFAPASVSGEFIEKTFRRADKSGDKFSQKVKDFFSVNLEKPYRVEKLADGTLIICWRVMKRRDVYDAKIKWLKDNVTLPPDAAFELLEQIHDALPVEPPNVEPPIDRIVQFAPQIVEPPKIEALPVKTENGGVIFYTHDDYPAIRRKFSAEWRNLSVGLNHDSAKLQHEGWDEFESGAKFGDPRKPNEIAFTLTGETSAREAMNLFGGSYGGAAYIMREGASVEEQASLDFCNNPFRLPLNEYTYAEFKRRFSERWTNLSIELYDKSPIPRELPDDFEMKNLKHAENAYLHDYAYLSTWKEKLVDVRLDARILNKKLRNLRRGKRA